MTDDDLDVRQIIFEHRVLMLDIARGYSLLLCRCPKVFRAMGDPGDRSRKLYEIHALHVADKVAEFRAEVRATVETEVDQ